MQKKLLTAAVAGALAAPGLALAQASVEVYGTLYPTCGWVKYSEGNTERDLRASTGVWAPNTAATNLSVGSVSKADVQAPSSNFGVRGRKSVGGGGGVLS